MKLPFQRSAGSLTSFRILAGALLCLASGGALACSGWNGSFAPTFDLNASDPPGTVTVLQGTLGWFTKCDTSRAHPVDVSLEGSGLTQVSTIVYGGKTYVTYQLSATSPLFFFPLNLKTSNQGGGGGLELIPANEGAATSATLYTDSGGLIPSNPNIGVVTRAGMQPVPSTRLGVEVAQHTSLPEAIRHTVSVTVNIQQPTCTLSSAGFSLADVSAGVLAAPGSSSREQDFQVKLQCDAVGIPVKLTLTDANAPTATGSLLTPTANATAEGVQVELLRSGVPVKLGQQWNHGTSSAGAQNIDLQARYTRVAGSFEIGVVEGQAVLTADYR